MRIKSIIGILIVVATLAFVAFNLPRPSYAPPQENYPHVSETTSFPSAQPTATSSTTSAPIVSPNEQGPTAASSENSAQAITFSVGEKRYSLVVKNGASVLDAMRALQATQDFQFTGHEYPSLGFFVDSINGVKSADGFYWFLYVNGESSLKGASQTELHAHDAVEWRYKRSD